MSLEIRKVVIHGEDVWREGGRGDAGGVLRKVAVLAIVRNPYAGAPWSESLDDLVKPSAELGWMLGAGPLSSSRARWRGTARER